MNRFQGINLSNASIFELCKVYRIMEAIQELLTGAINSPNVSPPSKHPGLCDPKSNSTYDWLESEITRAYEAMSRIAEELGRKRPATQSMETDSRWIILATEANHCGDPISEFLTTEDEKMNAVTKTDTDTFEKFPTMAASELEKLIAELHVADMASRKADELPYTSNLDKLGETWSECFNRVVDHPISNAADLKIKLDWCAAQHQRNDDIFGSGDFDRMVKSLEPLAIKLEALETQD